MPTQQTKLRLPQIEKVSLRRFSLFTANPNAEFTCSKGVLCLVGANGIGKSTLLSAINFCLTGIVCDPNRTFESMDEYYRFSRDFSSRYFRGRIDGGDEEDAEITVLFRLGGFGYAFMGTELGAPFSPDIDATVKLLSERGYFLRVHDRLHMAEAAKESLSDFGQLDLNKERMECLQAACASTAAFSVGMVSTALANEPELSRARSTPLSRFLLEDAAQSQLYEQFQALRTALARRGNDLRLPAVVWLSALYRLNANIPEKKK